MEGFLQNVLKDYLKKIKEVTLAPFLEDEVLSWENPLPNEENIDKELGVVERMGRLIGELGGVESVTIDIDGPYLDALASIWKPALIVDGKSRNSELLVKMVGAILEGKPKTLEILLLKKEGFYMDHILDEILERYPSAEDIVRFYDPLKEVLEEPRAVEGDEDGNFST